MDFSLYDDWWKFAIGEIATTVALLSGSFYFLYRKRTMENTATSKIRSAAQGYIELEGQGKLMDGDTITAQLTGRTCTWYSYQIEELQKSGKNSRYVTIDKGVSDSLFLFVDDTGQCVVDPEGASVTPAVTDVWYGRHRYPTTGPPANSRRHAFLGGRYRYTEKRMHPGDTLYAIGMFSTVGGTGGEFNIDTEVRDLLKQWKQDSESLLQSFDKNEDGEIDIQEWQQVREQAFREIMANHSERKTVPPVNLLADTRDSKRPFILSAISQPVLIRRFNRYAIALMILAFLAGILTILDINYQLNH